MTRNLYNVQLEANKLYRKLIQEVCVTLQGTSDVVVTVHLMLSGKGLQSIPCPLFPLQSITFPFIQHLAVQSLICSFQKCLPIARAFHTYYLLSLHLT